MHYGITKIGLYATSLLLYSLDTVRQCRLPTGSDDNYLSTKVLKYVLKYFFGTLYLLVLKYFRKLVLSTYT